MSDKENKKVEELEQQVIELETSWKRALADYKNLERRMELEREQIGLFATEILVKKLLPVLDNLELTTKHLKDQGLELTLKDFSQILKDMGLTEVEALGKDFNPNEMEAIDMVEGEKNKVLETLQKGYVLNNKVLRAVRVKVGSGIFSKENEKDAPTTNKEE